MVLNLYVYLIHLPHKSGLAPTIHRRMVSCSEAPSRYLDNWTMQRTVSKSVRDLERANIWNNSRTATQVRCQA